MSSAVLERAPQTLRWLLNITSALVSKEQPYSLSCQSASLQLQLPVSSHLSLHHSSIATGLEVIGWDKGWLMSCTWLCLKWSCLLRASLTLLSQWVWSSSKTRSIWLKTRGNPGAAGRWWICQPTACGASLLIFSQGLLPYTESSQLLIYTFQIWWHDLFTYTLKLFNCSRLVLSFSPRQYTGSLSPTVKQQMQQQQQCWDYSFYTSSGWLKFAYIAKPVPPGHKTYKLHSQEHSYFIFFLYFWFSTCKTHSRSFRTLR